jgi:hypothetical protein
MAILIPMASRNLLKVIEDRFGIKSNNYGYPITSRSWHKLFEDNTIAGPILDLVITPLTDLN